MREEYEINVVDRSYDGILVVKLLIDRVIMNLSSAHFICSPKTRGSYFEGFYSHLLPQVYLNSDSHALVLVGDYNSRINFQIISAE